MVNFKALKPTNTILNPNKGTTTSYNKTQTQVKTFHLRLGHQMGKVTLRPKQQQKFNAANLGHDNPLRNLLCFF